MIPATCFPIKIHPRESTEMTVAGFINRYANAHVVKKKLWAVCRGVQCRGGGRGAVYWGVQYRAWGSWYSFSLFQSFQSTFSLRTRAGPRLYPGLEHWWQIGLKRISMIFASALPQSSIFIVSSTGDYTNNAKKFCLATIVRRREITNSITWTFKHVIE